MTATRELSGGHQGNATHEAIAAGAPDPHHSHSCSDAHAPPAVVGPTPPTPAIHHPEPLDGPPGLAAPFLALAADIVDDLEHVRTANQNRLRQLTRTTTDTDGEQRGFGLTLEHPDVARLSALVDMLTEAEHKAVLNLQRAMRQHPLGPWVKTTRGIGEKQAARLLAAIGDPYWNTLHDRPRTVAELWQYCGHGGPSRRRRGERGFWDPEAKKRTYLLAKSCVKAGGPYREVYDQRRAETADRAHTEPCVRCGPSGRPAQPGSPWSAGHQDADAVRVMGKEILRDLWDEARKLHA